MGRSTSIVGGAMTWGQRLKHVFGIDVNTCGHFGGAARIVASVSDCSGSL